MLRAAVLFALAAALTAFGALSIGAATAPSPQQLRETLPLAALIGAAVGARAFRRPVRSRPAAAGRGVWSAALGLLAFVALYILADTIIGLAYGDPALASATAAFHRVADRLLTASVIGAPLFALAGALSTRRG